MFIQLFKPFLTEISPYLPFPLYQFKVQAGFPSPADDYIETKLDLNKYLISSPSSTFFIRVNNRSMMDSCIRDGDLLVVDRSLEPRHNKIVVAVVRGKFTVKKLKITVAGSYLVAENNNDHFLMKPDEDIYIWGIVKSIIREV